MIHLKNLNFSNQLVKKTPSKTYFLFTVLNTSENNGPIKQ